MKALLEGPLTPVGLAWKVRGLLSAQGRSRARHGADWLLRGVSSISGSERSSHDVALTFDDGPDPLVTPLLLNLLRERQARATFFILTDRVATHPDLIRRMVAEGHEIALHGDRHERLTSVPGFELRRRLAAARLVLSQVSGRPIRFFRPPFGSQSLTTYLATRLAGLEVVVWTQRADDWLNLPANAVAMRALDGLAGGDVLLLHDGLELPEGQPRPTFDRVDAVGLILDGMAARGLAATTVGELVRSSGARRTAWFRP